MKSLALFNNKGGVGKTTLTFNIAHMLARKGHRTVALDYDPQCNLSALFLAEEEIADIWEKDESNSRSSTQGPGRTVAGCIEPVLRATSDLLEPELVPVADDVWLLPGHLRLSRIEQNLAVEWPMTRAPGNERALDVITALARLAHMAADRVNADIVLVDTSSSLGLLSRAALLTCDAVVVPLAPDLFNLQSLANVGDTLREWRDDWDDISSSRVDGGDPESLPVHRFHPIGYIVQQHLSRARGWVESLTWAHQIPWHFHRHVLADENPPPRLTIEHDEACIASLKHVASLIPIAQIARKPIFDLKQADGIGGGQLQAVARCRAEFDGLVTRLLERLERLPEAKPAEEIA